MIKDDVSYYMSLPDDFIEEFIGIISSIKKPIVGKDGDAGQSTMSKFITARFVVFDDDCWPRDLSIPKGWPLLSSSQRYMAADYIR